jgi:iron complex transport system permease protein
MTTSSTASCQAGTEPLRPSSLRGNLIALALLGGAVLAAFAVGRFPVGPADIAQLLWSQLTGQPHSLDPRTEAVIWNIRGPRIASAVLIGAALAMAGAAFQGLFRNPLVSPDILGASTGAALGAVLGIFFSIGILGFQLAAFAGGLVAVGAVYAVGSTIRRGDPVLALVLTGVVIGSLLAAGIGLVKFWADPYNQLPAMTFWLLGSLNNHGSPIDLAVLAGPILLGTAVLMLLRWRMNVMSLPEEEARALGLNTGPIRLAIVAAATLVTSASVAAAGIIGWVGLVVPHLARFLVGPDFGKLLPTAALLGGGYLLIIDTITRTMSAAETPLGILTAVVGTPFFIWLLASSRGGWS